MGNQKSAPPPAGNNSAKSGQSGVAATPATTATPGSSSNENEIHAPRPDGLPPTANVPGTVRTPDDSPKTMPVADEHAALAQKAQNPQAPLQPGQTPQELASLGGQTSTLPDAAHREQSAEKGTVRENR